MDYHFKYSLGDKVKCKLFLYSGNFILKGVIIGCSINNIGEESYSVSFPYFEGDDYIVLIDNIICKL